MNKKILLIDDEIELLRMMVLRLESRGYTVVTAANGRDGLEKVRSENPDLIIVDVLMPVMDGFEFFKIVKKDPAYSAIPVIVLTARGAMRGTFEVFDADAFMAKPFDAQELVGKIDFLLARKALVLCKDPDVIDLTRRALKALDYTAFVVEDDIELEEKAEEAKYGVIIIHLPLVTKDPREFLSGFELFKNKNPRIIIYSDNRVQGTESSNLAVIERIEKAWRLLGVHGFYDKRIVEKEFGDLLRSWIAD